MVVVSGSFKVFMNFVDDPYLDVSFFFKGAQFNQDETHKKHTPRKIDSSNLKMMVWKMSLLFNWVYSQVPALIFRGVWHTSRYQNCWNDISPVIEKNDGLNEILKRWGPLGMEGP